MNNPASKPVVFVIDDTNFICTYVKAILESLSYEVSTFNDPLKALKEIGRRHCDLILLDINMPKMSGFDFLEKYTHLDKPIPVCIISASSEKSDVLTGLRLGAVDYLVKPIQPQILIQKVQHLLNAHSHSEYATRVSFSAELKNTPVSHQVHIQEMSIYGFLAVSTIDFNLGSQASFFSSKLNQVLKLKNDFLFQTRIVQKEPYENQNMVLFQFVGLPAAIQSKIEKYLHNLEKEGQKKYLMPA